MDGIGGPHAILDNIGNLGFDALLAGRLLQHRLVRGLNQFGFWHGIGAFDEARHTCQQALLCFRFGHCFILWLGGILGRRSRCSPARDEAWHACGGRGDLGFGLCVFGGIRVCLSLRGAALLAALGLFGLQALGSSNCTTGTAAKNVHYRRIDHDRADQQEAGKAGQLNFCKPENKSA